MNQYTSMELTRSLDPSDVTHGLLGEYTFVTFFKLRARPCVLCVRFVMTQKVGSATVAWPVVCKFGYH